MHLLYFAYGSNMLRERLQARTPSAVSLGPATLQGHALHWHKAGSDGSGKCDIVPDEGQGSAGESVVHGVLYRLALAEKPLLDAAESLGVGYGERQLQVRGPDGPVLAYAYVALGSDPALQPYDWYKALVVAGARQHGLDGGYLRRLEATPARPDADLERTRRHLALIPTAVVRGGAIDPVDPLAP